MEDVEDIYALSPMQHGMLFDSVTAGDAGMYLIQLEYFLGGTLSVPDFERAWQETIDRHPILRTSFHWDDLEKPLQVVHRSVPVELAQEDWSELAPAEQERRRTAWREADRERGVAFDEAPLSRLALFRLGPDSWCLLWSFHHVLMEGWSASLLLREVLARYRARTRGGALELPEHRPYRDYVAWFQEQDPGRAEEYWRRELADYRSPTHLAVDRSPTVMHAPVLEYDGQKIELSAASTSALQAFAQRSGLTLNTIVQGAWALLLSRYADSEDVVFGTIVSGRSVPLDGVDTMVGLFVNLLPARVRVPAEAPLIPWLAELQAGQVQQREFEYSSLAEVKSWSEVPAGLPLFESILVFENWAGDLSGKDWDEDLTVADIQGHHGGPGYPIAAVVVPGPELTFGISYDTTRFDADTIGRLLAGVRTLLEGMVADPEACVGDLPLLGAAERREMVVEWNRTADESVSGECVHHQFERQAERTPDAPAVLFQDERLTYRELDLRANQLAHLLRSKGAHEHGWVGLCVERDLSLVVGLLGILKAGCAYVPIDPAYPAERQKLILEDSGVGVLVTQERVLGRASGGNEPGASTGDQRSALHTICLDADAPEISRQPTESPRAPVSPEHPAYMIYTSGSTGRPKGVMVPHRALSNYTGHALQAFAMEPSDRTLQFASISFDTAAEEVYPTLAAGATLRLRTDEMLASVADFLATCADWGVTVVDFPTAYWHVIVDGLADAGVPFPPSVRLVILGGEAAKPEQLATWFRAQGATPRLLNTYGPTEATIVGTSCELAPAADSPAVVPIGRPIRNVSAHVLDQRGHPAPIGVPGELCLGGAGLAHGYFRSPALTAERFVPDPFSERPGARLYRTGDLVRRRPDGELEFCGRRDHQVKFRGYRIELDEIAAALAAHAAVQQAVVLLREDRPGSPRLVAYVVPDPAAERAPTADDLKGDLEARLPAWMIPSATVLLDTLPLTAHGKLDRDALPEPDRSRPERASSFVAPRSPMEEQVAEIWREVLEVDRVGVYDNFFDLGGHSLLLMSVIGKLKRKLGVRMTPGELVQPTLGQLAAICEKRVAEAENEPVGLMRKLARAVKRNLPS